MLDAYLSLFDRAIDHEHYQRIEESYCRLYDWEDLDELPHIWSDLPPWVDDVWPDYAYNDTFFDREKMLLSQLRHPYLHHLARDYHPLAIRANYGTVILPSILGAEYQLTESSMPWAHHLPDRATVRRLIDAGVPDVRSGLGGACLDTLAYYCETIAPYPNLARQLRVYHPDMQGPFDVAHLLWGPDIFLALYDVPQMVHELLDLVVRTFIEWLSCWRALVQEEEGLTAHWSFLIRGATMLRDDTPVMLSRAQYLEFVKPYDQRVLDAFGGGIHFCGRGDHFVEEMVKSENLYALHISQPELNDMASVWALAQEHRLVLLGVPEAYLPQNVCRGATVFRAWRASHNEG